MPVLELCQDGSAFVPRQEALQERAAQEPAPPPAIQRLTYAFRECLAPAPGLEAKVLALAARAEGVAGGNPFFADENQGIWGQAQFLRIAG